MDRDQVVARLQLVHVTSGLDFRYAQTDQTAHHTASSRTDGCPAERRHDRTGRDKRTDTWNGQCSDACKQAEDAASDSTGRSSCCRALRRLGCFDMTDVMLAFVIGQ